MRRKTNANKLLLIGPLLTEKDGRGAGGTNVLFDQLLRDLRKEGVDYKVIDSNTNHFRNNLHTFVHILKGVFTTGHTYDHISLHGNTNHFIFIAPILVTYAKIVNKPFSLRKFAGVMHIEYEQANALKKALARFALRNADVVFFETKYLVEYFKKFNPNTFWFPNVRQRSGIFTSRHYEKKFIFIGSITREKGVGELLKASDRLDETYTIDLYGQIDPEYYREEDFRRKNLRYRGVLAPDRAIETIRKYDALVLPSYREGYPGVIIEAFMAGRPVLATSLPSIREMVKEGETGFLVEPKSVNALVDGFMAFDEKNFPRMAENAYRAGDDYDSEKASRQFLEKIGFLDARG